MNNTTIIIIVAVLAVLILGFLLMRPKPQRLEREGRPTGEPYVASKDRPYMKPQEGKSVAGEAAAATTDVAGAVLSLDAHRELSGVAGTVDNLTLLKGVGPKFAARLNELGVNRYDQLAGLSEAEVEHLDERVGPFRGRLTRDRVIEQADYLARGDVDGFEEKFGKLGA